MLTTLVLVEQSGWKKRPDWFPRLELPTCAVSPAARENGGRKERARALMTESRPQFLERLARHTSSNHNHNKEGQKPGCLSAPYVRVGPLHRVMSMVAGCAAAAPPPPTAPQDGILVTMEILHQPNASCFKTTIYCLTGQKNPLLNSE